MTEKPFRPLLAADPTKGASSAAEAAAACEAYFTQLLKHGPLLASFKLDGIRALHFGGAIMSRSMKTIPNQYIQRAMREACLQGLDGELIHGRPYGEGVFQRCTSAFMSHDGAPQFTYHVFDDFTMNVDFDKKLNDLRRIVEDWRQVKPWLVYVEQKLIGSWEQLLEYEAEAIRIGYEGLIVRDPRGYYKQGRSTLREGIMVKLKRFTDSEAEIIGFEELLTNANEQFQDERGYARRSSSQAGKIPAGRLGALVVRDVSHPEWVFNVGSGFDDSLRQHIWDHRPLYVGQLIKYKYLSVGVKDLPRHPIYLGLRNPKDIS